MKNTSWYNLYSTWVLIIAIVSTIKIVPFSIIPSSIGACICMTIFYLCKVYLKINMGASYLFGQIIMHIFPLLILPLQFTKVDIIINLALFILYNVFLFIQGLTVYDIYSTIIYEKSNTFTDFLEFRNIL
jgi:hypothetical protein